MFKKYLRILIHLHLESKLNIIIKKIFFYYINIKIRIPNTVCFMFFELI